VTRLKDMGIPTFLITATVEAILAQRLVRRVCGQCREEALVTDDLLFEMGLNPEKLNGKSFYKGRGCDVCNNTGYKGRVGLFELMLINDSLRDMIMRNVSVDELRQAAEDFGMVTLRTAGIEMANQGTTTAEEVVRETIMEA
jgi:type IV pilus assembly protein PilB